MDNAEIVKHLGKLSKKNNWTKEVNIVSWYGGEPKIDIRDWDKDHNKCSKGIILTDSEFKNLMYAFKDYFEYIRENESIDNQDEEEIDKNEVDDENSDERSEEDSVIMQNKENKEVSISELWKMSNRDLNRYFREKYGNGFVDKLNTKELQIYKKRKEMLDKKKINRRISIELSGTGAESNETKLRTDSYPMVEYRGSGCFLSNKRKKK